jgi:hypothetical protein
MERSCSKPDLTSSEYGWLLAGLLGWLAWRSPRLEPPRNHMTLSPPTYSGTDRGTPAVVTLLLGPALHVEGPRPT